MKRDWEVSRSGVGGECEWEGNGRGVGVDNKSKE